jgi:hypothetical protein
VRVGRGSRPSATRSQPRRPCVSPSRRSSAETPQGRAVSRAALRGRSAAGRARRSNRLGASRLSYCQPTVLLPADCPIASRLSYCQPTVVLPADCRIASRLSYCQPILLFPRPRLSPGSRKHGAAGRGGAGRGGAAPSTRRRTWRSYPARTAAPAAPTANQSTEANDLITCTVGTWVGATVGRGGWGEITRQTSEPAVHFSKKCSGRHQPASRPVCGRAAAPSGCGGGRAGHKAGPPRP